MAYIIAAAGGHGDYINNEVNAAFLGASTRWVELRASSLKEDMRNAVAYEDGRRGATHTYRTTQHIDRLDRTFLFSIDGPNYSALPSGGIYRGQPLIMAYNHGTGDWDPPTTWAPWPGQIKSVFVDNMCCKHPSTEAVYCAVPYDGNMLRKFDPDLNIWSVVASSFPGRSSGAIDPIGNRLIAFGESSGTLDPVVLDLESGTFLPPDFGGLGMASLRTKNDAGIVYDEVNGSFLVFPTRAATSILRIRAYDLYIDSVVPGGETPSGRTNGWQNSWQFVPALKGVVCAAAYNEDMLYLRTSL